MNLAMLPMELETTLKKVSRTLYFSLRILPTEVRSAMGLGYLFCRAADSIVDTRLIPHAERLRCLDLFANPFQGLRSPEESFLRILSALPPQSHPSAEKKLLEQMTVLFALLRKMTSEEQALIKEAVLGVVQGMRMDLKFFPGERADTLQTLESKEELERYCGLIGGVPGAFWTKICLLKLKALQNSRPAMLTQQGIALGRGLQITNILRDIAADLRIGRCYLPGMELKAEGLSPTDLLNPQNGDRLKPVLHRWIKWALEQLYQGEQHILSLPQSAFRLRAAAGWPLLLSLKTLQQIGASKRLLDPAVKVKISRPCLYATLLTSSVCFWTDAWFRKLFESMREDLLRSIQAPVALP